jgi:hypothetical protein
MRTRNAHKPVNTSPNLDDVKKRLAAAGWSNRTAAAQLGCTPTHLSYVLNGHRQSRSLIASIEALPVRPVTASAA